MSVTSATAATRSQRMRDRPPAYALEEATVQAYSERPTRSRLRRMLGFRPLDADGMAWLMHAKSELEVARILDRLPATWTVFHSLPLGRDNADVDHVVVGPAGAFTINANHHPGKRVAAYGRSVRVNGVRQNYIPNGEYESKRLSRILLSNGLAGPPVHAVVVIVGARSVEVKAASPAVSVVTSGRLLRWLAKSERRIDETTIGRAVEVLDRPDVWRAADTIDPTLHGRFLRIAREVVVARLTRIGWVLLLWAGIIAALLTVLPRVLDGTL